ncbi:MAG: hypothetical protein HC905_26545 [Bacteroidales bacterium]|nr:hypothetical protein [Bacteroidales bacterium]
METIQNIDQFIQSQLAVWEMPATNYQDLKSVKTKSLHFDGFEILVQFNPKRIISSAAKVDTRSIEARPCFCAGRIVPSNNPEFRSTINMLFLSTLSQFFQNI